MSENKQQLITDNMKLVYHIINSKFPAFSGNEDIIQEGMLGLCKAADTFDESKSKFTTYACTCIYNQIKLWFRNNKKHFNNLSLDYLTTNEECESIPLVDMIIGDDDVDYVDIESLFGKLSERERNVCELAYLGYNNCAIAEKLGISRQNVGAIKRKIENRVRKRNGNN